MAYTKKFKKMTGRASTAVKKRYGIGKGRGGFKFQRLAKDLMDIKSRLNVEKKFLDTKLVNGETVGQFDDENAGYYSRDLTPLFAQGTGENNRVGNSLKLTGAVVRMNFRQQANAGKRIAKICIIKSKSEDSVSTIVSDVWDNNPLSGIRDFNSPRNYASMRGKNTTHQILATRYVKIEDTGGGEDGVGTIKIPVKMNDILRFSSDGDTSPEDYKLTLVVFLDYGNKNILNSTQNAGALIGGVATGAMLNHQVRFWFVDN